MRTSAQPIDTPGGSDPRTAGAEGGSRDCKIYRRARHRQWIAEHPEQHRQWRNTYVRGYRRRQ